MTSRASAAVAATRARRRQVPEIAQLLAISLNTRVLPKPRPASQHPDRPTTQRWQLACPRRDQPAIGELARQTAGKGIPDHTASGASMSGAALLALSERSAAAAAWRASGYGRSATLSAVIAPMYSGCSKI